MDGTRRITVDPNRCGGRPCIRGLRIRVKDVLDLSAAGATREEILEGHPLLDGDDITAVLEFATRESDHAILPHLVRALARGETSVEIARDPFQ